MSSNPINLNVPDLPFYSSYASGQKWDWSRIVQFKEICGSTLCLHKEIFEFHLVSSGVPAFMETALSIILGEHVFYVSGNEKGKQSTILNTVLHCM